MSNLLSLTAYFGVKVQSKKMKMKMKIKNEIEKRLNVIQMKKIKNKTTNLVFI